MQHHHAGRSYPLLLEGGFIRITSHIPADHQRIWRVYPGRKGNGAIQCRAASSSSSRCAAHGHPESLSKPRSELEHFRSALSSSSSFSWSPIRLCGQPCSSYWRISVRCGFRGCTGRRSPEIRGYRQRS